MTSQTENRKNTEVRIDEWFSVPHIPYRFKGPYHPFTEEYEFSPEDKGKRVEILNAVKDLRRSFQDIPYSSYEPPIRETAQLALFTPNVVFGTHQRPRGGLICEAYKSNKVWEYQSDNRIGIKVGAYSKDRSRDGKP
ncbi:MAG: hypothetical protein IIC09_02960, partial [Proteobacteria bacterium]|nr:hypothetical protein [Pseudomonadota bacterium]